MMSTLGHVYEKAYAIDHTTEQITPIFEFDSPPTCGLIGPRNEWFLIGGTELILRTNIDSAIQPFGNLKDIHSLKLIDECTVLILTDPWSKESAIYKLSILLNSRIRKMKLEKIRNFTTYQDQAYTENVKW